MPAPIALRPEEVPDDLICSICYTIPVDPVLTPCEHIFCRECINQALNVSRQCPIDREACTTRDLQQPTGCLRRIWSNVQVKCGNSGEDGCAWTGAIGDYANHAEQCNNNNNNNNRNGNLSQLREELESVKRENRQLAETNQSLNEQLASRPDLPHLFDGEYNFGRNNVVELSQLISRYLENKPADINPNRIYNCVRSCYIDLKKGYADNPEYYSIDMKMLFVTIAAGTWFTDRQKANIRGWYNEQF